MVHSTGRTPVSSALLSSGWLHPVYRAKRFPSSLLTPSSSTTVNALEERGSVTFFYLEIFLVEISARQPHRHSDLEIGILLEGQITLNLEHTQYKLEKGNIYIINRYQVHSFFSTDKQNLILAFQIHADLYRKLNEKLKYIHFNDNVLKEGKLYTQVSELLFSCANCYFSEKPFYEIKTSSLFLDAFYKLLENGSFTITSEREYHNVQNNTLRINRITEYISEHYQEPISLQTISDMENISICHASHFITRTLGISFQEYLNNIRFDHALKLLAQTDLNILDICMETGFSSSRYLNQMFEKNLGCTVKEYKKKIEKPSLKSAVLPTSNIQRRFSKESSASRISSYFHRGIVQG